MIRFSRLRQISLAALRCGCAVTLLLAMLIGLSDHAASWADQLGYWLLAGEDAQWQRLALQSDPQSWEQWASLGDISRHHRYAPLKTQHWQRLLAHYGQMEKALQRSMRQWAKRNKRDLDMQLTMVDTLIEAGQRDHAKHWLADYAWHMPGHAPIAERYQQLLTEQPEQLHTYLQYRIAFQHDAGARSALKALATQQGLLGYLASL